MFVSVDIFTVSRVLKISVNELYLNNHGYIMTTDNEAVLNIIKIEEELKEYFSTNDLVKADIQKQEVKE